MTDAAPARGPAFPPWTFDSGPAVAVTFHRALALIFLIAWTSLGVQVRGLIGADGLLPLANFVDLARAQHGLSFFSFPSLLSLAPQDGVLVGGTVVGALLAALALLGVRPRACVAAQTLLYLTYATACRTFLGFQWDNLLLEAGLLAVFLPVNRRAPVAHFLLRALLFKLYFESGLAKWQSPAGDWRDGSAMTYYYQTAPLPTVLAWYAHHLPAGWHHFESRATLVLELLVPFAIFGPRRARLLAAAAFTAFQVINALTANYGFFCYLATALHVLLLDDADLSRVGAWAASLGRSPLLRTLTMRLGPAPPQPSDGHRPHVAEPPVLPRLARGLTLAGAAAWLVVSFAESLFHFGGLDGSSALARALVPVLEVSQTFRLVNTYHLFAAVTRERIEPELQLEVDGTWTALSFAYKPGPPHRAPPFVAPHQPRVDFLLWFYGLSFARGQPAYVADLLGKLCENPDAVAPLFTEQLPRGLRGNGHRADGAHAVSAVRIVFWDYRLTTPDERRATHAWWSRHEINRSPPLTCAP